MHTSGEWISSIATMPIGVEKGKSSARVADSTITVPALLQSYATFLDLYVEEDTNGNAPQSGTSNRKQPEATKLAELSKKQATQLDRRRVVE